jgi:transposase InsO family protein
MPWKESLVMEERLRFVARLLEGEAMTDVCRDFGISRKTGYKVFDRYREHGLTALTDRSRRPVRYANQLPQQIESLIVSLKRDKPHWGARKIRELLVRRLAGDIRVPAKSTIHAVLDRNGLVKRMRRTHNRAHGTPLSEGAAPNDLWCADFKGEFKLGNGRYCYPLTVTDHASRFLLLCEALDSTREELACTGTAVCRARAAAVHPLRQLLLASQLGPVIRSHWAVENSLHWVMDVIFRDDECRVRTDHAPANFTTLKHMAHNLIRKAPGKDSFRLKRKVAAWDDDFLASLIAA